MISSAGPHLVLGPGSGVQVKVSPVVQMIPSFLTLSEAVCHTFKSGDHCLLLTNDTGTCVGCLTHSQPSLNLIKKNQPRKKTFYPGMIMVKATLISQGQHRAYSPGTDTLSQPPHHQTTPWGNDSCNTIRGKTKFKSLTDQRELGKPEIGSETFPRELQHSSIAPTIQVKVVQAETGGRYTRCQTSYQLVRACWLELGITTSY